MKKTHFFTKLLSIIICTAMFMGMLPITSVYAAVENAPREWIVGFDSADSAKLYAESNQAEWVGGPFVLAKAQKSDLAKTAGIVSLTENATMKGTSVSNITDTLVSDQYILTHKSLYAKDGWSRLENALANLETPLTPADCATIRVAVIDSGIDATHEDLANRVIDGYDAVNKVAISKTENSDISNDSHGTKVAGLIGAASDNAVGVAGMAWTFPVELMPVRVLDNNNNGKMADVITAIYWAVDEGKADIINISFGKSLKSVPVALQTAVLHAVDNGVIVVCAAGNDNKEYKNSYYSFYPAALEGVLPVGSTAKELYKSGSYTYVKKASFSNKPYTEYECAETFFFTPGEELLTTAKGNTYEEFTGTSASSAVFSGMIAAFKSFADTTGKGDVLNYIGHGKYSYIGALYYEDYSNIASYLVNGQGAYKTAFYFYEYTPAYVFGQVELEGILNDTEMKYESVSFYFDGVLVDTVERNEYSKQHIVFNWDTTQFEDGWYGTDAPVIMGKLSDGTEEEIDSDDSYIYFTIGNNEENYIVKVLSGGTPVKGADATLYNMSNETTGYTTNTLGQIYISPEDVDDDTSMIVVGDGIIMYRTLEQSPLNNEYIFGANPSILTVKVGDEKLEKLQGTKIYAVMPDGTKVELATIEATETIINIDTDTTITFNVSGPGMIINEEIDLSEGDYTWDLDTVTGGEIVISADSQETDNAPESLGVIIDDYDMVLLGAEGGSITLSAGKYHVYGVVKYADTSYYKVDLGNVVVTKGEETALTIGIGELAGQLKISPETVTEGENVTLDYILKDSEGNNVVGLGYMDEDGYCYGSDYAEIMIEAYDGETGEWMEVNSWGDRVRPTDSYFTRFILDNYALGDGTGKKRVTLMGSYLNEKLADETVEFEVLAQETRPHAVVTFEMYNAYEYTIYDVVAATLVENEEGETILRRAFNSDDGPMIRLPVGKKYTVALIGNDYDQMYITKAEVDLTETENGETVTVTVPYSEDEWAQSTVMGEEADNGMCFVSGLAFKPFAESDSIIGVNNQLMDNLCTIHAKGMGTVELLFTLSPDFYECENYEYPPVFTIKKTVDTEEAGEIMLGAPKTASVKVEVGREQNATITPYITDAFGNEIISAEYQSRYPKMEGGDGGMEGGIAPSMNYPVITVYNSEAEEIYNKTTKFEKVELERLEVGAYAATLTWDSSDIHPESEQVNFTIGETEEEAPVIGAPVAPPTNFRAKATEKGVVLTWTKSVSEIAHYFIYRDGELLCELGDVDTYTDTNPGDSGYKVYTIYAANEEGERSDGVTAGVRLIPAEDNEAPIWGDGAEIVATVEDGGVSLRWSKATDEGTGVMYYTLYCNGQEIAQKFTRTHTYNGLMPDVDYTFTVTATDGNGNVSEPLESDTISIESGILGHNLVYAKNRLGYMTGTAFTAVVNTTGDIESLTGEIKYTLAGGESKTENVEFSGANGYFTWSKTFEATLTSIDALTVKYEDGYECIESPILRKMAKVKVKVELSDLAEIYPRGTLTLYSKSLDYAYTYPVTNMEGTIEDTIIAAADYTVTLAGGNGQVLINENHSITEDTEITLDENSIRLLKVVIESPQTGFTVTLESDNGAVAGVSCEDGTIIWQNGSEWISVGESVTLKNEKFFYSEKLTLENVINVKTIDEKVTDTYEEVTAHIRVKDTDGNHLDNVRVQFATSVDKTYAVTDERGGCEAELVKSKWYDFVYINIPEQKQRDRVILNKKTAVDENGTTEVVVEIGYEDIEIIPVLDVEADMDKVTFTLDGEKISLHDGKLYQRRTSDYFKKDENLELLAEYTADGVGYKGMASFTRSETQPQEVNLEMKRLVNVKLSLTDNGDVLKGTKRYYKIYDSKNRMVDSFSTYDAVSTVKLMEGNFYTASAGWGLNTGSESFIAREGMEVTLNLKHNGFMYGALGGEDFFSENGFATTRSISLNKNGDIYVKAYFTSWYIKNPDVSEAYNYIVLPDGAENVEFEGLYEYDSTFRTIRLKRNLAEMGCHYIDVLSFTIPYEKLTEDATVASHIKFVYDGETYTRDNNGFSLMDYAMALNVPERASVSEAKEGVKVSVSLPLARKGTLEIYDGTSLVASSMTDVGKVKYDFNIKPSNSIGSHTIKAVYTADEASLTRQRTLLVVDDGRPVAKTAMVRFDSGKSEDILNPKKTLTYQVNGENIAYCTATFTNPDKVERAWLVGKTDSEFDRVELFRKPGTDQFTGKGRLGDITNYITALRIEFEEAPLTLEDMEDVIYGDFEWDYEHIVPVGGSEAMEMYASLFDAKTYEGFDYGPYYGQSEESQAKAMEDWNTYVQMVNNGVFEKDETEAEAEFEQLFGEDNTWEIPSVTNGKEYFQKSFKYDPDKIEEKLNSPYAFSVNINGEKRKVLIEVEIVDDEMYIVYYGLGDLLMPRVPQIDTDTVSGAGVSDKIDEWTKKAVEAWDKWKNYGKPIKDLLDDDDDGEPGGPGGAVPCGGGESSREKRRKEVEKAFDEGWELAKEIGELLAWLQIGGFSGGGVAPDLLTDDDGVAHKLFELQEERIHQIDDILDEMNPDPPEDDDPCDPGDPNGPGGGNPGEPGGPGGPGGPNGPGGTPINPLVDPSGYLYRGGEGYAAEGVNASIYYLEEDGVTWTLWNSEDYGEGPNPYLSEANGYYGWDVLMGRWKVVFEGEGYNRAESIELDVPPPHLDVDIMLTSTLAPKVEEATIKADGSIYIKFDHLMTLDSVNSDTVTVKLGDEVLTGAITPVDETVTKLGIKQKALETDAKVGVRVASIFKFTPTDAPLSGMSVSLDIDKSILGYNGISMKEDAAYSLTVPEVDSSMTLYSLENVLGDNLHLTIGESYDLSDAYKATYTDGFGTFAENKDAPIVWSTNAEGVATVTEDGIITANGDGIATIFGECEGEMIAFGVYVERAPLKADKSENTVKFCREDNLVVEKACYMWSDASNFRSEGEIDGDEKYMPASWRIKEGGTVTAEGVVPDTESAILEIYTPQSVGVLVAEIDYELYKYSHGRWVATGQVDTAIRQIEVTEVTSISVNTAPDALVHGEKLDLSNMLIDIQLSDGTVSTVKYGKLKSYGITMSMNHGDTVTVDNTTLTLSHERTGQTLDIPLTVTHEHDYSEEWIADGIAHWHECSICNEKEEYGLHTVGVICSVCNFDKMSVDAKAEITSVENGKVKITCDTNVTLTLIFADYELDAVNSIKRMNITITKGENEIAIPEGIVLGSGDKLMLWKVDFIKLKSVSNVYVIK